MCAYPVFVLNGPFGLGGARRVFSELEGRKGLL